MSHLPTEMTQTLIEINAKLHFSQMAKQFKNFHPASNGGGGEEELIFFIKKIWRDLLQVAMWRKGSAIFVILNLEHLCQSSTIKLQMEQWNWKRRI